ncbi:MAG: gamma-glutamyltransferase family protein [Clostridiaceae bacterium]
MKFDPLYNPYRTTRNVAYGRRGMVACSMPCAAEAGFEMLKNGGNAIDAAVAAAATLTVCEPTSNGVGGDAFAIVWWKGKLYGLNSSGPSPGAISMEKLKEKGLMEIPEFGWETVNVPGIPAAWANLSAKFGKLPFEKLLDPAIGYAEDGYPVSPVLSFYWKKEYRRMAQNLKGDMFRHWFEAFAPGGRPPEAGEIFRLKELAKTLREIAETKAESFYRGDLADKIDAFSRETGGYLRKEDLEAYYPEWVKPISVNYKGYDVFEIPPNGQGITALMALNILKTYDFKGCSNTEMMHKQIEAVKLAFEASLSQVADINKMKVKVEDLLSETFADENRRRIGRQALMPKPSTHSDGGTVYLAAADDEGNMISYIQSNYIGFGSGLVVPGTQIALHSRGRNFSFDPGHPNALEPNKKPYHTIIPGFLMKDGDAVGPFGIMGGFMQPQAHVQVLMNCIDLNMNPQAALDAPRWIWMQDKEVRLEREFGQYYAERLEERGHNISVEHDTSLFGRGQIIWKDAGGAYIGATDSRTDGTIYSW